jgi:hypothetical protein
MDYSIDFCDRHKIKTGLYIQHQVPTARIGDCVKEMRVGPCWVELGKFRDNWLADRAFEQLVKDAGKKWKLSIGFLAPRSQVRKGVYTKLFRYETSVVERPACPQTIILVGGNMSGVNEDIMKLLDPDTPEDRERYESAITELLAASQKSLEPVEKAKKGGMDGMYEEMKALAGMLEGDAQEKAQKLCDSMKGYMEMDEGEKKGEKPEMEYEEEDEEMDEPKKKELDLGPILEAVKGLGEKLASLSQRVDSQVEGLSAEIKSVQAESADAKERLILAQALATALKRMPEEAVAARPSAAADVVKKDDAETTLADLAKSLGGTGARHPFADFAGAPTKTEGGL